MYYINTGMYADETSVGDWAGDEALVAHNFNRILDAIAAHLDDNDAETMQDLGHYAWDVWGSREELLTITDAQVAEWVDTLF